MTNGEVIISGDKTRYAVKVCGRATFECMAPLRALAKKIDAEEFQRIEVDLTDCQGMDSTFMGVLAMMALRARKIGGTITIYNADELNRNLLYGLGLKRLFEFAAGQVKMGEPLNLNGESGRREHAATVLEAHKTLMDMDEANVKKFEKIVDYVQKDLDRLDPKAE